LRSRLATRLDREVPRLRQAPAASASRADRAAADAAQPKAPSDRRLVLGVAAAVTVMLRRDMTPLRDRLIAPFPQTANVVILLWE